MPAAAAAAGASVSAEMAAFRRRHGLSLTEVCREIYHTPGNHIQVRNEQIAVDNLARIIDATLSIANRKGFAGMSLRDLAARSGLSLGGLYAYIKGKDDLVRLIQSQGRRQTERVLRSAIADIETPAAQLGAAIRAHVFLSDSLRAWFHFLYMESRLLETAARRTAVALEQDTERLFEDIIRAGQTSGSYRAVDAQVAASLLKPLLQDWYLKHRKHRERGLDAAAYAAEVDALMQRYLT